MLEFGVRGDEHHGSRGLVDLPALDADQAVLDDVEPADALLTCAVVQFLDGLQHADVAAVDRNRNAAFESDDDLVRGVPVDRRVLGVVVDILGRRVPQMLEEAGLHGTAPDVLVDRERRALGDVDRDGILLGERDGLLPGPGVVADRGEDPRSGASEANPTSKRTWSLPLPVQPCATIPPPCSRAAATNA